MPQCCHPVWSGKTQGSIRLTRPRLPEQTSASFLHCKLWADVDWSYKCSLSAHLISCREKGKKHNTYRSQTNIHRGHISFPVWIWLHFAQHATTTNFRHTFTTEYRRQTNLRNGWIMTLILLIWSNMFLLLSNKKWNYCLTSGISGSKNLNLKPN